MELEQDAQNQQLGGRIVILAVRGQDATLVTGAQGTALMFKVKEKGERETLAWLRLHTKFLFWKCSMILKIF